MAEKTGIQLRTGKAAPMEVLPPMSWMPAETEQAVSYSDLRTVWRSVLRRRWTILGVFTVIFVSVLVGTLLQTPIYRATGVLEIRKENADIVPVETLSTLERLSDDYLATQVGILKSQTLARDVISDLGLVNVEEFNPRQERGFRFWRRAPSPIPADELMLRVADRFKGRLSVTPVPGSRLVNVSFESEERELATRVVNAVLSAYIDLRVDMGQKTADWLASQLGETKTKLEQSEVQLQAYVRENGLLFLESKGSVENIVEGRLRQLQERLTVAQSQRIEKQSLHEMVVQKGEFESIPSMHSEVMKDLTVRLADLRREYARLTTTFKEGYPQAAQVKSQMDELEALVKQEQRNVVGRVTNDYQAALQQEELLRQAYRTQEQLMNSVADKTGRYNILKRDVDTNRQLYDALQQKLKEAGVSAGLKAANVGIIDQATPPRRPDRPNVELNLALALVVGMALGVGAGFLREYLDTSVKTPEEIDAFSRGLAVGMIPSVRSLNGSHTHRTGAAARRMFPTAGENAAVLALPNWHRIDRDQRRYGDLSEAFGSLRTSLLLNPVGPQVRSLVVTSSQPGEGKTTVSANLAISLAQLRRRTLLIDADIRRPCLHRLFRVPNRAGLTDFLVGGLGANGNGKGNGGCVEWRALVQPNVSTGLDLLTSGKLAENPAELLSSPRMVEFVSEALLSYDFVVLDSPPLFVNVADTRILTPIVDGTVLVVRSGMTPRDVIQRALAQCSNVIGIVLNDVNMGEFPAYYSSPYGSEVHSSIDKGDL